MKSALKLELAEARQMVTAALAKAREIGVLETVCITDEGGFPLALERMDGARVTGPQIAWNKAFTAAGHKRSTHLFNQPPNGPALPGNEAFGIQWSFDGKFAVFVGGFPIVVDDADSLGHADLGRLLEGRLRHRAAFGQFELVYGFHGISSLGRQF